MREAIEIIVIFEKSWRVFRHHTACGHFPTQAAALARARKAAASALRKGHQVVLLVYNRAGTQCHVQALARVGQAVRPLVVQVA
jgi:hypothetical protein